LPVFCLLLGFRVSGLELADGQDPVFARLLLALCVGV